MTWFCHWTLLLLSIGFATSFAPVPIDVLAGQNQNREPPYEISPGDFVNGDTNIVGKERLPAKSGSSDKFSISLEERNLSNNRRRSDLGSSARLNAGAAHSKSSSSGHRNSDHAGSAIDDHIYSLVHFKSNIKNEMYYLMNELSETFRADSANTKDKLRQLEAELRKQKEKTAKLEDNLAKSGSRHRVGDIRLVEEKQGTVVTSQSTSEGEMVGGYLQFYTGSTWGFVCDDFFNEKAGQVACRQLGHPTSNVTVDQLPTSQEPSWAGVYSFVLDDIICQGNESALSSCYHSDIGQHDCTLVEMVYLQCYF